MRKILPFVLTVLLLSSMIGVVHAQGDCPPSRLIPFQKGRVTAVSSNRMRAEPSLSGAVVDIIPANSVFVVGGTPTCADGYLWVYASYDNSGGWTAEAKGSDYFVEPVAPPDGAIVVRAYIADVAWSSDGHTIALATHKGVYLLDADLPTPTLNLLTEGNVDELEFSPTAPDMLATSTPFMVRVWDLATKKVLYEVHSGDPSSMGIVGNIVGQLQFSSDGKLLFAASPNDLDAYDTTTWQPARVLQGYVVDRATMSPDGQMVAVKPRSEEKPYLTDWSGKRTTLDTGDLNDVIFHMRFSPDSRMLVMNDNQGHVVLDSLATGETYSYTATFDDDYHLINGLTFSPDSKLLTIGDFTDQGGVLRLMNTATMQQIGALTPDGVARVTQSVFSPDGSRIASIFDNVLLIVNTADIHG